MDVVKACVALHNMFIYTDTVASPAVRYIPPNFVDGTAASGELLPDEWRRLVDGDYNLLEPGLLSTARASWVALTVRNDVKSYFQTGQGLVPWQDTAIQRGFLNFLDMLFYVYMSFICHT